MTEDLTVVLREIADHLKQRNTQTAELAAKHSERAAQITARTSIPDFNSMREQHEKDAAARQAESERRRAEDVEFRERLLTTLERQNQLLGQLLGRSSA